MSDDNVNPIFWVILMVAVTVLLAALIAALSYWLVGDIGIAGNVTNTTNTTVNATVTIAKMCCECVPC